MHVEMTLNSKVELTNLVHAVSDEFCRLAQIDEDAMMNLGLALREATVNAMKHGNKLSEHALVRITFDLDASRLLVTVTDQGEGFNSDVDVDPRLPENLDKTSGRGLFLMRTFVDSLQFHHEPGGGMAVSLIKKLPRRARSRRC